MLTPGAPPPTHSLIKADAGGYYLQGDTDRAPSVAALLRTFGFALSDGASDSSSDAVPGYGSHPDTDVTPMSAYHGLPGQNAVR